MSDWFDYHMQTAGNRVRRPLIEPETPQWEHLQLSEFLRVVFASKILRRAIQEMRDDDRTAGLEGVRPAELPNHRAWHLAREVEKAIVSNQYAPGEKRCVEIPKHRGGTRTIRISNIADGAVARVLADFCSPLIDPHFFENSFGWRPKRNALQMLARLKIAIENHGLWYLSKIDVRQAFDTVRLCDAIEATGETLHEAMAETYTVEQESAILALVGKVVAGGDPARARGVDQGCPLSPIAMNCVLHQTIDAAWAASSKPRRTDDAVIFRYGDDIVVASRSEIVGRKAIDQITADLDKRGLEPRPGSTVTELGSGETPEFLGYCVARHNGKVELELPSAAKTRLAQRLEETLLRPSPTQAAREVVEGWVAYAGAAHGTAEEVDRETVRQLRRYGVREGIEPGMLAIRAKAARQRWLATVTQAQTANTG